MKTFLLSIGALLLLLTSTTLVAAFSAYNPPIRHCSVGCTGRTTQPETFITRFATEEDVSADDITSSDNDSNTEEDSPKINVKCPDCDLCDGSGRILGGIGTVLEWWPIKAYRPCPNFIERGGRYVRSGQGLDEIAFGRDSTFQSDE